jgi:hypothetical protein
MIGRRFVEASTGNSENISGFETVVFERLAHYCAPRRRVCENILWLQMRPALKNRYVYSFESQLASQPHSVAPFE